jgi:TonB family protein
VRLEITTGFYALCNISGLTLCPGREVTNGVGTTFIQVGTVGDLCNPNVTRRTSGSVLLAHTARMMPLGKDGAPGQEKQTMAHVSHKQKRRRALILGVMLAILTQNFATNALAQQIKTISSRKLTTSAKPIYPSTARKLKIAGSVKLEATVSPDGAVAESKVIGGNPLLVQAVSDAIAKWKWQPGPQQTKELVEVKFELDSE